MSGEGWFAGLRRVAVVGLVLGAAALLTGCAGAPRLGAAPKWQNHFRSVNNGAILISLNSRRLSYWGPGGKEYREFSIAVPSEDYLERRGRTSVVRRRANPDWRPTPSMQKRMPGLPSYIGPGPHNPLGEYALYLGWRYYAIHGTNNPRSIGTRATSGCFRLHPRDIKWLFAKVRIGTPVRVVDNVNEFGARVAHDWRPETDKEFAFHAKRAAEVEMAAKKKAVGEPAVAEAADEPAADPAMDAAAKVETASKSDEPASDEPATLTVGEKIAAPAATIADKAPLAKSPAAKAVEPAAGEKLGEEAKARDLRQDSFELAAATAE